MCAVGPRGLGSRRADEVQQQQAAGGMRMRLARGRASLNTAPMNERQAPSTSWHKGTPCNARVFHTTATRAHISALAFRSISASASPALSRSRQR